MIVFITGGQRSGKSSFAEKLLKSEKSVCYIATAKIFDEEMQERVRLHRQRRPEEWRTAEGYTDLDKFIKDEKNYLFECLGTFVSNIMFDYTKDETEISDELKKKIEERAKFEIEKLISKAVHENKNLFIVGNEVGFSLTSENQIGRIFQDINGRTNQYVAEKSDQVYLVVSGIEVKIK